MKPSLISQIDSIIAYTSDKFFSQCHWLICLFAHTYLLWLVTLKSIFNNASTQCLAQCRNSGRYLLILIVLVNLLKIMIQLLFSNALRTWFTTFKIKDIFQQNIKLYKGLVTTWSKKYFHLGIKWCFVKAFSQMLYTHTFRDLITFIQQLFMLTLLCIGRATSQMSQASARNDHFWNRFLFHRDGFNEEFSEWWNQI